MKPLAQQILETLEVQDSYDGNAFWSIRENLAKAEEFASKGRFDKAEVFASLVHEDSLNLMKDLRSKK